MFTRIASLICLLALSGCVAVGVPVKEVQFSDDAVVLLVPIVLQDDKYDCGVSALSMLLAYYGHPCDPAKADVLRKKADAEEGLTGADLVDYLKSEGLHTALFQGDFSRGDTGLFNHLDRGRPLIVALNSGADNNHFVLIAGYDPENDWILVQDPWRGALIFSRVQFEHAWAGAMHFTLLATPKE
jgi:ABC-type bacteriocin/lantibiotic exporter with double-glycine peptidase domain